MSTQVTESRYKSTVKTKARKTNNHASFGGSLLQNNMEVEAAIELARHLDETGSHLVCTGFVSGLTEPKKPGSGSVGLHHSNRPVLVCIKFVSGSCKFTLVYTEFVPGLFRTAGFSGKIPPFLNVQTQNKHFTNMNILDELRVN